MNRCVAVNGRLVGWLARGRAAVNGRLAGWLARGFGWADTVYACRILSWQGYFCAPPHHARARQHAAGTLVSHAW